MISLYVTSATTSGWIHTTPRLCSTPSHIGADSTVHRLRMSAPSESSHVANMWLVA